MTVRPVNERQFRDLDLFEKTQDKVDDLQFLLATVLMPRCSTRAEIDEFLRRARELE